MLVVSNANTKLANSKNGAVLRGQSFHKDNFVQHLVIIFYMDMISYFTQLSKKLTQKLNRRAIHYVINYVEWNGKISSTNGIIRQFPNLTY